MYLYKKTTTILKEQNRVIEDIVVTLKLVKTCKKFLCGFIQTTNKEIIPVSNQKFPKTYSFQVKLDAAIYEMLSVNHDLMIDHVEEYK